MTEFNGCRWNCWPLGTPGLGRAALGAALLGGVTLLLVARAGGADPAVLSSPSASPKQQLAVQATVVASPAADAEGSDDNPKKSPEAAPPGSGNPEVKTGTFHLGIQITTLPEVVRSQLQLKHGVLIERVLPDSPAAKAGLKPHDIVLKAGDTAIDQPEDILKVLRQADGKPLALRILREGQEHGIEVTPEPAKDVRPEGWRGPFPPITPFPPGAFGGPMPPDFKQWPEYRQLEEALERFRSKIGRDGVGLWFARPGFVLPPGKFDFFWGTSDQAPSKLQRRLHAEFADGWTVEIVREEPQSAKVRVQRGEQSWEVTEERLHELPKEVVPRVQRLLGMGLGWRLPVAVRVLEKAEKIEKAGKAENTEKPRKGEGPEKSPPAGAADRSGPSSGEIQKLLERLERANQAAQEKMEEAIRQIRKELEELRRGQVAPAKP